MRRRVPKAVETPPPVVPDMVTTVPAPPAVLDEEAAKQWHETARILVDRRKLTKGDLPTLANYIRLGLMIRESTISADWRLVSKLIGTQTKLAHELGLTPLARESMRPAPVADDPTDDPMDEPMNEPMNELERFEAEFDELGEYRHRLTDSD